MLLPCWIAETFSGSGSNVTLVWPSMVVCVELLPARLICVSSPNAANLLTTSFRSPRYCAHISGIGKLIAADNPLPVFSRISKIQAPWCNYQKQWENILFLQSRALFFFFLASGSLLCHSLYEGQHSYMIGLLLSFLAGKSPIAVKSLTIWLIVCFPVPMLNTEENWWV